MLDRGAHTITSLAFPDDLILVEDAHNKAQALLAHTEQYFKKLGMTRDANKRAPFQINTKRDSWHMVDTHLRLAEGESIPSINPTTLLRNLVDLYPLGRDYNTRAT